MVSKKFKDLDTKGNKKVRQKSSIIEKSTLDIINEFKTLKLLLFSTLTKPRWVTEHLDSMDQRSVGIALP